MTQAERDIRRKLRIFKYAEESGMESIVFLGMKGVESFGIRGTAYLIIDMGNIFFCSNLDITGSRTNT